MKKTLFLVAMAAGCIACDDIIEEVDISNRNVIVFAPLEGSVLTTNNINFNWDSVEDATSYRIQIADPDFENTLQLVADTIITTDTLGNNITRFNQDLFNGNYTWRVKALNSGFETAYVTNAFEIAGDENLDVLPPNTPILIAPENGASIDETEVTFSWSREDIAGTAEEDTILFFEEETLTTLIFSDVAENKTFTATLSPGTFYWIVRSADAAGNRSEDSEVFSFTIN